MENFNTGTTQVVHFKNWSRKKYAIFCSLKKLIKVCSLVLSYSLVVAPVLGQTAKDTILIVKDVDIDEVVVTANHEEVAFNEVARMVSIINESKIETHPAGDLTSLLETLPSIDVRQRGPQGIQSDLGIKGGTHNQNLILLNNTYFNNPQTGHHNLNLPFSATAVTKIEVLEGSSSRIWGPNAFSGVVNFRTTPTPTTKNTLLLEYGQHNFLNSALSYTIRKNKQAHKIDGFYKSSDGYIENTDFASAGLLYSGLITVKNTTITPTIGVSYKRFGAQNYYSSRYPLQHEYVKNLSASVNTETSGRSTYSTNTFINLGTDRFELFREGEGYYNNNGEGTYIMGTDTLPGWYGGHNYHFTRVVGHQSRIKVKSKLGTTFIGVSLLSEKVLSTNLGDPMNDTIDAYFDNKGQYTKSKERNSFNTFIDHTIQLGKFKTSFGVLAHKSNMNDYESFNPGIDFSYHLNSQLNFYGSANKAIRYPSFTELYYYDGVSKGDVNLKPEKSTTYEIGAHYRSNILSFSSNLFYIEEENAIDFLKTDTAANALFQATNIAAYEKLGFTLNATVSFPAFRYLDYIQVGYMKNEIIRNTSSYEARYSIDQLSDKLTIVAVQHLLPALTISYTYNLQNREGQYEKLLESGTYEATDFETVGLFDLKINYQLHQFNIYYKGSNLLNKKYVDFGNIVQPRAWHKLGVVYHF